MVEWARVVYGDNFVEEQKLRLPRAVKVDVEGYEYAVIRGLTRTLANPQCKIVCCEVHPHLLPPPQTPGMVLDLLERLGFQRIETHPRTKDFHAWAFKDSRDRGPRP